MVHSHCYPSSLLLLSLLFSYIFSFSLPDCRIDRLRFFYVHYKKENKKKIRDKDALLEYTPKINYSRFDRWGAFDELDGVSHYCYWCDSNDMYG